MTAVLRQGRPLAAAAWMAGSIVSFSALAVAGREVGDTLGTFEIMLYRAGLGVLIVAAALGLAGRAGLMRPRRLGLHALRNAIHFAGQNLWFYALTVLPLAQVVALEFTTPVWVILLAPLFLGERLTGRALLAAAIGLAGVVAIARPDLGRIHPGLAAAALCAVSFALTAIATKRLTRTETVGAIMFWLNLMQLVLALAAAGADGAVAAPAARDAGWILLIGVAGVAAHWCLTCALDLAPASVVMPLDFARLPVVAALGWAVYGEAPGPLLWLGAGLIIGASALSLRPESRVSTNV